MLTLKQNQHSSKGNMNSHNKPGTSHSPNIRMLPQSSNKRMSNPNNNGNNINNIATIKTSQIKPSNTVKYPYTNQKKIQVIGDLNSFQIHQSNIYSSPYENIFTKKDQQIIHNQQLNNMNNKFKRKGNKNIPRKSPIPIIKDQQRHQHLLQIIRPIKRNNQNEINDALSQTLKEEKKNEGNARSLSPIQRRGIQSNQIHKNGLKNRFVSKSPVLGRPTFLDRFKKFHITNNGFNYYNSFASATTMMYLKKNFSNINVYRPNSIQNNKDIIIIDSLGEDKSSNNVNSKMKTNQEGELNTGVVDSKVNINEIKQHKSTISAIDNHSAIKMLNSKNKHEQINDNNDKVIKEIHQIYTFTHVGFDGEKEKENNQDSFFIESNFCGNANHIYMSVW